MPRPFILGAPHRPLFLAGTLQALAVMGFWMLETGGHYAGLWAVPQWSLTARIPPSLIHGMFISLGVFPFFVFGFILTAGPRWQGRGDLPPADYVPAVLLLAVGWLVSWLALAVPNVLAAGLGLVALGWGRVAITLTRLARIRGAGGEHIRYVAGATWLGTAAVAACMACAAGAPLSAGRLGLTLAVWGFLLPVFATVAHRMLPFFTASALRGYVVRRPAWALRILLAGSLAHGALSVAGATSWSWLADVPALLAAAHLSRVWWSRDALANRMLAVLHIPFAWLAPALALFAVQSAVGDISWLGQAPLHALTLGFFASMLLGMATRVSLGHSGQPIAANAALWAAFWMIQTAAVVRITAEVPGVHGGVLIWLSSLLWLVAFGLWASRHAWTYWRPNPAGAPE